MMKPTLKDVAEEAGVSISTVSMVLSGKGKISAEVSNRVLEAARKTGYRKKQYTASSSKKRSKYITILNYLSWDYEWLFVKPFVTELESVFFKKSYFTLLMDITLEMDTEELFRKILASGAAAVCTIHYINEHLFEMLEEIGIPVVIINNSNVQNKFHSVCVDDFQGAYEGAMHLIELGHTNIIYVEYERNDVPTVVADRYIGFKKAVDEHDIPFPPGSRITVTDVLDLVQLENKLAPLFRSETRPTAVFAHDDYIASKIIYVLLKFGLFVPDDVSIIAPGDTLSYRETFTPQITTLSINTALMGNLAGDLAMNLLHHDIEDLRVLKVKQQLIERGSCRRVNTLQD
jgi:LacI family transcriptional regulator